jgi:hypothetical protein
MYITELFKGFFDVLAFQQLDENFHLIFQEGAEEMIEGVTIKVVDASCHLLEKNVIEALCFVLE